MLDLLWTILLAFYLLGVLHFVDTGVREGESPAMIIGVSLLWPLVSIAVEASKLIDKLRRVRK